MDLKPGRELDALIAEKIFGCKVEYSSIYTEEPCCCCKPDEIHSDFFEETGLYGKFVKGYSTDIAAAWEAVEMFMGKGYHVCVHKYFGNDYWTAQIDQNSLDVTGVIASQASSAPHAICLAALKAIGFTEASDKSS